jgi:hydrogenase expression/formation protein HypC
MCLAIPAKILSIEDPTDLLIPALADFGGITKKISLSLTPEAKIGHYVIVHVGFAISIIDEEKANQLLDELDQITTGKHEISIGF